MIYQKKFANKLWILMFLIHTLGFLNLTKCQDQISISNPIEIGIKQIIRGTEKFSFNIFQKISDELSPRGYNIVLSPFSVWSLLILLAEGADGKTYNELQTVLGLPNDLTYIREGYRVLQHVFRVNTSTVQLAVNQAIFTDNYIRIENPYTKIINDIYEADIKPVNFQNTKESLAYINGFVSNATNGRIRIVLTPKDTIRAHIILISAIYFKGEWKIPFDVSKTKVEPFYDEFGTNISYCQMMYNLGDYALAGITELNSFALEIPYGKEDRLSMIILLPGKNIYLRDVIDKLGNYGIPELLNELNRAKIEYADDEVQVYLPKFRIKMDLSLKSILNSLNLTDVFDQTNANLSKLSRNNDVYLSSVIHKAEIEVDEIGTTASAASGGTLANKIEPPIFHANKPFAFLIVEKTTKILLFCGEVRNP